MNPFGALALDALKDKIKERFANRGQVITYSTEVMTGLAVHNRYDDNFLLRFLTSLLWDYRLLV